MTKSTSLFLDGLRVLAALTVFFYHFVDIVYANAIWLPGQAAVIVFFVLSGYVITYSTLGRRQITAKQYILARLSRLYSVVIPALILTAATVLAGKALHLPVYDQMVREYDTLRFICTGLFLQSIWWRNLCPPGNGAFWSLSYEFWYYVLFGCMVFVRNWRWKIVSLLACCLIVGSNILLLFPGWLLGVALYLYGSKYQLSARKASLGFIIALVIAAGLVGFLPKYPGATGYAPMFFSGAFLSDWVLALGFATVIWFFEKAWGTVRVNPTLEKAIQWPAKHSFSLYLFHTPLITFFDALDIFRPYVWWSAMLEIGLILIIIAGLAELTESKRKVLTQYLTYLWNRVEVRAKV